MNDFLVHHRQDNVGVAVVDVSSGKTARGVTIDGKTTLQLTAVQDIVLRKNSIRARKAMEMQS